MISVCMATYNGAAYLQEQVTSILKQLAKDDELIISDDGSTDETYSILQTLKEQDARIKLFKGPGKGVIANFSFAISQASGDYLFLADQDDVWLPDKVAKILALFKANPKCLLILSDLMIVNQDLQVVFPSYFTHKQVRTGFYANILRNTYIGAGMAFRRALLPRILPIPENVPMHDMWIGLLAEPNVQLFAEPLTLYRRHEQNASELHTKASRLQQLKWRLSLTYYLILRKLLKK